MSVERVDFLVEEPSMEAALQAMLPSWLGELEFAVFPHQGKQDLLHNLPSRLKGYGRFLPPTWRIVVLVDRDDGNCKALKKQLEDAAVSANLRTRSTSRDGSYQVANRVVIEEIESWYFGDWDAVRMAFPKIDSKWPGKAGYRDPDAIAGGTWEAFERVAQAAGYFKGGLRKVDAAKRIGAHLDPIRNTSRSFQAFRRVIDELISGR